MDALNRFGFVPRHIDELAEDERRWFFSLSPRTAFTLCINGLFCPEDVRRLIENQRVDQAINMGRSTLAELWRVLGMAEVAEVAGQTGRYRTQPGK